MRPVPRHPSMDGSHNHGRVMWLFADGAISIYNFAYPSLAAIGHKGVGVVCATLIDTDGHMTTANLTTLTGVGWEIGSHGYAHDNPTTLPDSPPAAWAGSLQEHLQDNRTWLIANGFSGVFYGPPAQCNAHVLSEALIAGYTQVAPRFVAAPCVTLPNGHEYGWTEQTSFDWGDFLTNMREYVWNVPSGVLFIVVDKITVNGPQITGAQFDLMVALCRDTGVQSVVMSEL